MRRGRRQSVRRRLAPWLAALTAGCAANGGFSLTDRPLTCEQANDYAYRTLRAMRFDVTAVEPAAPGRPGSLRGVRTWQKTSQRALVHVECTGTSSSLAISEEGALFTPADLKRGFYMSFTGVTAHQDAVAEARAADAVRPMEEKRTRGLIVSLDPVRGQAAKLDFNLDLAASGVLPVRLTLNNVTERAYTVDPTEVVLLARDGRRVAPLSVADVAARVMAAPRPSPGPAPSASDVTQRLASQLFTATAVPPGQVVKGYLYFPLADYARGRVSIVDTEAAESEGFVVEF